MREGTEYAAAAEIGKAEDNPIIIDMIWCFGIDIKNDLPDFRNVDQDQPTMSARFLLFTGAARVFAPGWETPLVPVSQPGAPIRD